MVSSSRIFVKGLPPSLTVEEFRKHFSKQSPITDAKLLPHRRIGYVGFRTPEDATRAVKYHNRSFIRMSKIAVELARSVDEQKQALRGPEQGTYASKTRQTHDAIEAQGDRNEELNATASAKKWRRLSAEQNVDEKKLQEFLQVMQPPSKSRAWNNQDVLAVVPVAPLAIAPDVWTNPATDEKSDGEYEPVHKKLKISREVPEHHISNSSEEHVGPQMNDVVGSHNPAAPMDGGAVVHLDPEIPPAANDDDWLRSRTSRLLGLVDDDEMLAGKSRTIADGTTADKIIEDEKDPGKKQSEGVAQVESQPNIETMDNKLSISAENEEPTTGNARLFLRNLTYTVTEDDIRTYLSGNGYEGIEEVHLPLDLRSSSGNNKGFAHVQFSDHESAMKALEDLDQKPFHGRLLHILPSDSKPEVLDEFAVSKLPLKQQQHLRRKAEAATSSFNWNSMYMSSDAVISSVSDRLGVAKSEILDPTSSDAAVKQAHAETHIIQETKAYFKANGVDLDAFKKSVRGNEAVLVKNFPFGTKADELRNLFEIHGPLKKLLMPPSGAIAIVEFYQADHARSAFSSLSYSKFKGTVLFLEKAPKSLFASSTSESQVDSGPEARQAKPLITELLDKDRPASVNATTLFVRNLNFATTGEHLKEAFKSLDGFMSARVKTKPDPKRKGQTLSMGFGFLEFRSKQQAQAALGAMDGFKLDGHELLIRESHKAIDAAEEKRKEDQAKKLAGQKTKIIIKNLPFEATKKEVRSLFGAYGQLRSVRVPKKFDSSTRGFAFADFITAREAESAMDALKDSHLLGRRLVLQFAAEAEIDPEAEIEQMQKKVGMQADKVALQKLTGTGRRKFNSEGADEATSV